MKFQTQYNRHPVVGEKSVKPGLTLPNKALTIRQLLERNAKGLPIAGIKVPMYDEDDDFLDGIDPRKLDIAEFRDMMEHYEGERRRLIEKWKDDGQKFKLDEPTPPPPPPLPPAGEPADPPKQ